MEAQPVGLAFAVGSGDEGQSWYVPCGHREGQQLSLSEVAAVVGPLLARTELKKVAHNGNYDMMALANAGMRLQGLWADTMIAAHLLGYRTLNLKGLVVTKLNQEMTPIEALIGTGRKQVTFDRVPIEQAAPYAAADARYTLELWHVLERELHQEEQMKLFQNVEMPLVPVLVRMQRHGIALDVPWLHQLSTQLSKQVADLEAKIYQAVGHQFNIGSPQQLSRVLFEELHLLDWFKEQDLPRPKRTESGYSTDAQVLEDMTGSHPVVELILEYRQLTKLKSTYIDALPAMVNPRTGRVHTTFNQAGAVTGRISSSDPNLQNIPVRTDLGQMVRRAFIAEGVPSWTLLAADYSQIELRVLAHFCRDARLVEAFQRDEDIHRATAASSFRIPPDKVTPEHRRLAKMINFGLLYGMSEFGLAQRSGLPREEAATVLKSYFESYPGILTYLEETKTKAQETGYVETVLGRRRAIPEVRSSNRQVRAAAERMAVNMPIQGTAADIIKVAMLRLQERMDSLGLQSKMLLQVHDELIFEVPQEELEVMTGLVHELMPTAIELSVPLKVDVKTGYRWSEME
jgi:DNA polymerase-1